MHKLDPEDMDALFREGADKHEFTYNPDAWAMMEDKLDNKNRKKYFLWFFLGFLFLGGVVGTYFFTNGSEQSTPLTVTSNNEIASENTRLQTIESEVKNSPKGLTSDQNDVTNSTAGANREIQNSEVTNIVAEEKRDYINANSVVRNNNRGIQSSIQSENTGSLVDNEVVSVSSQEGQMISDFSKDEISNIGVVDTDLNEVTNYASVIDTKQNTRGLLTVKGLKNKSFNSAKSNDSSEESFNLQPSLTSEPIILAGATRYVLTAFASSDYSSVGFFSDPQTGFTLGTKVGIQLARKYQFDLGFAYSLKRYGSEGVDYNVEGGWNTMQGVNPTWMDGKGNVLQIPLEATYYINGYENNSFFVNAGISSYLFNSEWYGFKYNPEDLLVNPNALEEITMDDIPRRNFHLAGIARVAIGYQRIISPNMAFEISPYLQIPLTGIGEGKVDLYTAGVQFAVKFNTK